MEHDNRCIHSSSVWSTPSSWITRGCSSCSCRPTYPAPSRWTPCWRWIWSTTHDGRIEPPSTPGGRTTSSSIQRCPQTTDSLLYLCSSFGAFVSEPWPWSYHNAERWWTWLHPSTRFVGSVLQRTPRSKPQYPLEWFVGHFWEVWYVPSNWMLPACSC